MQSSIYHWSLRPEDGLDLELRIVAESAVVARRRLQRFLAEHDGRGWRLEHVSREVIHLSGGGAERRTIVGVLETGSG